MANTFDALRADAAGQPLVGMQLLPGTTQAPLTEISGIEAPAEELSVDPDLPILSTLFLADREEGISIPKFRCVGMKARTLTANMASTKPFLTLAGPGLTDPDPIGVAQFDLYHEFNNRPRGMQSVYLKNRYISYPFVNGTAGYGTTYYNSNLTGVLAEGDSIAPDLYGRPTKFVPQQTITFTAVATTDDSGTTAITKVPIPGGTGRYVPASQIHVINVTQSNASLDSETTISYSTEWVTDHTNVVITEAAASETLIVDTNVLLITVTYGHAAQKRYGQVGRILTGRDANSLAGYLSRQLSTDFPFAPMILPMTTTQVTEDFTMVDSPLTIDLVDDMVYTYKVNLAHKFVDPTAPITVSYSAAGSVFIPLQNLEVNLMYPGQELGGSFSVQAVPGTLTVNLLGQTITTNTSVVRITYSYESVQPRGTMGFLGNGGRGIQYLTDGTFTGGQGQAEEGGLVATKPGYALHEDGAMLRTTDWAGKISAGAGDLSKCGFMHILVY